MRRAREACKKSVKLPTGTGRNALSNSLKRVFTPTKRDKLGGIGHARTQTVNGWGGLEAASAGFGFLQREDWLDADVAIAEACRPFGSRCLAERRLNGRDRRRIELVVFQVVSIDRIAERHPEVGLERSDGQEAVRHGVDAIAGQLAGEREAREASSPSRPR